MNKSTRTIIAAAAIAGLYMGALAVKASASVAGAGQTVTTLGDEKSKDSCKGKEGGMGQGEMKAHDCKGQNECKGQGGCKSGDNGCKGKNSCKGKGGCATSSKDEKPKGNG